MISERSLGEHGPSRSYLPVHIPFENAQGKSVDTTKPVDVPSTKDPIDTRRIFQFRKQRGVNLGSWFSLETWLTGSVFQNAAEPKASEMDLVSQANPDEVRAVLEKHWDNFINDGDWQWMAQHGINSVRLPIGYFHFLSGADQGRFASLLKDTEYAKFAPVYEGAWSRILRAIEKARALNIGVLIDLHGAPGAQNHDGHSGLSTKKANLFHGLHAGKNQKTTIQILVDLAEAIAPYDNIVGLELLNEPQNNSELEAFYSRAIIEIRHSKDSRVKQLPLFLGDAWATGHYASYVGKHSTAGSPLVLDHHLYRCFTPKDHNTAAEDHAGLIDPDMQGHTAQWLQRMSNKAHGSIIIGEWSGALNPNSFNLSKIQSKLEARTLWSRAQWRAFEYFTAGYYYWTLKKEGGPDPGWCLYTAMEKGSMPSHLNPHHGRKPNLQHIQSFLTQELKTAYHEHCHFWDAEAGRYEHWRFEQGFQLAITDALEFLKADSEVGFTHNLAMLRLAAHAKEAGESDLLWEFEHGYRACIAATARALYA